VRVINFSGFFGARRTSAAHVETNTLGYCGKHFGAEHFSGGMRLESDADREPVFSFS